MRDQNGLSGLGPAEQNPSILVKEYALGSLTSVDEIRFRINKYRNDGSSGTGQINFIEFMVYSTLDTSDKPAGADLTVSHISRTPRYPRYAVSYTSDGPIASTGGNWPSLNQPMTYTAVVKNVGTTTSSSYSYLWKRDGVSVQTGSGSTLDANLTRPHTYQYPWDNQEHTISFELMVNTPANELFTQNNSRSIYTKGLSFRFHVEPAVYTIFNRYQNFSGTYSFEDWA
ncbi:MAG: hypothetical protein HYT35_00175, partial [Candidatus Staskawiczbacteria bacterium]|nr:hypothetical protein [Candidatus Staskawiczbacteria bacterium]